MLRFRDWSRPRRKRCSASPPKVLGVAHAGGTDYLNGRGSSEVEGYIKRSLITPPLLKNSVASNGTKLETVIA